MKFVDATLALIADIAHGSLSEVAPSQPRSTDLQFLSLVE
ncbi:hypothetical protein PLANPX_2986 [Lacipirellula parvula]|uniref:Uncharacterized protein n=1 Tax=Lacipirellula parvula TaxID=2650471 RepID=A0A5K7X9D4_9BACT|nr:hypothetical protein PLANPX_2986 [Lacipirellula parvula]